MGRIELSFVNQKVNFCMDVTKKRNGEREIEMLKLKMGN